MPRCCWIRLKNMEISIKYCINIFSLLIFLSIGVKIYNPIINHKNHIWKWPPKNCKIHPLILFESSDPMKLYEAYTNDQNTKATKIRSILWVYSFFMHMFFPGSKNSAPEIMMNTGTHHITKLWNNSIMIWFSDESSKANPQLPDIWKRITAKQAMTLNQSKYETLLTG